MMDIPNAEVYEAAMYNVRDGILRWLERPESGWYKEALAGNPAWAVDQLCLPEAMYEEMGAEIWLDPIARSLATINAIAAETEDINALFDVIQPRKAEFPCGYVEALWDDAMTQVCELLCKPDA